MNTPDHQKRKKIQEELKTIESRIDLATDRTQLRRLEDELEGEVETVGDPVLKTEYRRQLSALRGK